MERAIAYGVSKLTFLSRFLFVFFELLEVRNLFKRKDYGAIPIMIAK